MVNGSTESPLKLPVASAELMPPGWTPTPEGLAPYLERMILSASGWRTVFAADGDEESTTPDVRPEHLTLVGLAARVFVEMARNSDRVMRIAVGADTRPTGPHLAQAAIRCLLAEQIEPDYLFVVASPEIMAFTAETESIDGFFYVSASHNPIGHNGLKMGLGDGSVAGGEFSRVLVDRFRAYAADGVQLTKTAEMLGVSGGSAEDKLYRDAARRKQRAESVYSGFTRKVVRGPGPDGTTAIEELTAALKTIQPGIVADMNGSARSVSIDRTILNEAGCRTRFINDVAGVVMHQIVPEGPGLSQCVETLAETSLSDPGFILGYVPDNDGDRGNLVVADKPGSARPLEAQEVFALSAVSELSWLAYTGATRPHKSQDGHPVAIVVNGPTSMRIERIAALLGVEVHRAEVGEANVVALARELRETGYTVRFLGEGSNGGNITHPSAVRDPIQTLFAVLKLLYTPARKGTPAREGEPGREGSPGPSEIWLEAAGKTASSPATIGALLESLPVFTTTSAFEPLAIMHVATPDHAALKAGIERLWEDLWPKLDDVRDELRVSSFRYENYEGTRRRTGKAGWTGQARGGLKILLVDDSGQDRAFLWMRGSGTEPVFRVMVDVEGSRPETERKLLALLRNLVADADRAVTATG